MEKRKPIISDTVWNLGSRLKNNHGVEKQPWNILVHQAWSMCQLMGHITRWTQLMGKIVVYGYWPVVGLVIQFLLELVVKSVRFNHDIWYMYDMYIYIYEDIYLEHLLEKNILRWHREDVLSRNLEHLENHILRTSNKTYTSIWNFMIYKWPGDIWGWNNDVPVALVCGGDHATMNMYSIRKWYIYIYI